MYIINARAHIVFMHLRAKLKS